MDTKWIYHTTPDNRARFILGTKGTKPFVCIGVNPSTAEPNNLDPTLTAVEHFSKNLDYDSWIMINLYPQRATDSDDLHKEINPYFHRTNINKIKEVLKEKQFDIWTAWGGLINKRDFLYGCLRDIYETLKDSKAKWLSIGQLLKAGHPHHPLYLSNDLKPCSFEIDNYILRYCPESALKQCIHKEYMNIRNNIFYFDTNIISLINNTGQIKNNPELKKNILCLRQIFLQWNTEGYFVIPFSHSHFLDIMNGSKNYEKSSLRFLDIISKSWEVRERFSDKELIELRHNDDIYKAYNDYKNDQKRANKFLKVLKFFLKPLFGYVQRYMIKKTLDSGADTKTLNQVTTLSNVLFPMDNEDKKIKLLKINKKMRHNLKDEKGNKFNYPDFKKVKSKYPKKSLHEIVNMAFKESDFLINSFEEFINLKLFNDTPALSKISNQVGQLSMLAGIIGVVFEKLKSKTAFQGMVNDHIHLSYGLRCKCFVTEDDVLYQKSLFIRDWMGYKTLIFKSGDFVKYFLTKVCTQTCIDSLKIGEKKTITINFNDVNGELIKAFDITIKQSN